MWIRAAKRSNISKCSICSYAYQKGEKYFFMMHGVTKTRICLEHCVTKDCTNCEDKLICLTNNKQTVCIKGKHQNTRVIEP
jgi:hypothetical protein